VNAQIRSISESFGIDHGTYEVLCECGEGGCVQRLEVPVAVFTELRHDHRFVVAPGHARPGRDHVVAATAAYAVVAVDATTSRAPFRPASLDPLPGTA
jgi:hypothetical protein